jgi:hypothetical protein
MSVNTFASEWMTLERHTVRLPRPTNTQQCFISLQLDNPKAEHQIEPRAALSWRAKLIRVL